MNDFVKNICISIVILSFSSTAASAKGKSRLTGASKISNTMGSLKAKVQAITFGSGLTKAGYVSTTGIKKSFNLPKKTGLYEFPSSNGNDYGGQAKDFSQRIPQHVRSGKLLWNDIQKVQMSNFPVKEKTLNVLETVNLKVKDVLSKGNLANVNWQSPFSTAKQTGDRLNSFEFKELNFNKAQTTR